MKKNIEIKEPCSEDWEKMTATQRGAFCDKCAMEVYDFTKKSSEEIKNVLRLKLGARVCARVNSDQMDTLNADFEAWKMNSKRSLQSTLIFSLIVVFGLTLFSCEEDEEEQKIGSIQQIGMSYLTNSATSNYQASRVGAKDEQAEKINPSTIDLPQEVIKESPVVGMMSYDIQDEIAPVPCTKTYTTYGGAMISTVAYDEYLMKTPTSATDYTKDVEAVIEFNAFTFPNPAKERTTLRIMLPEEVEVSVQLFTLSGQLLRTINTKRLPKGETNFPIDLLDIPNGSYLIAIRSEAYSKSVMFVKI